MPAAPAAAGRSVRRVTSNGSDMTRTSSGAGPQRLYVTLEFTADGATGAVRNSGVVMVTH